MATLTQLEKEYDAMLWAQDEQKDLIWDLVFEAVALEMTGSKAVQALDRELEFQSGHYAYIKQDVEAIEGEITMAYNLASLQPTIDWMNAALATMQTAQTWVVA